MIEAEEVEETIVQKKKKAVNKKKPKKFGQDEVSNHLVEKYGDVIKTGTEVLNTIMSYGVLSFSPNLDLSLGGGIREGTCVGISGDPKTGKTTSVLHFAAKCQKLNKQVVYLNTEGRLNRQNFEGIKDLNVEKLIIVEASDKNVLSAEAYLNIAEYYIKNMPGCVLIIDSTSNMVPEAELIGEIKGGIRNGLPRLLSMFFKRISGSLATNKVIGLFVVHNIADTGPSRRTKMADCGNMLQYQVGTNLAITHKSEWKGKDGEKNVGQIAHWKVLTSNAGGIPQSLTEGWIRYGIGIDEVQEVIMSASELNIIKVSGSWYTLAGLIDSIDSPNVKEYLTTEKEIDLDRLEELKALEAPTNKEAKEIVKIEASITQALQFQGAAKVYQFLKDKPEFVEMLDLKVKELFL